MGVLNATPDSFYDGGRYQGENATRHVLELVAAGAFVVDVGGESTRPGSAPVAAKEQLERIEPAVKQAVAQANLHRGSLWVSVDTADPVVAETVLRWGAHVINDVSCLADEDLAGVVARANAALVLMHSRGPMASMAGFSEYPDDAYGDVLLETAAEWQRARSRALARGLPREDILFDPGIGFAKNARQSMLLLRGLADFETLEAPIVVGPSRKSFLNLVEQCPAEQRLGATIAACIYAAANGASLVRVHDVAIVSQALKAHHYLAAQLHDDARATARSAQEEGRCSTAS